MALRIVFVVVVFLTIWIGGGIFLYGDLPAVPGLTPAYTAMFLGAWVAAPLYALLVVIPATRNRKP